MVHIEYVGGYTVIDLPGEFKMLEKLILAAIATASIHLFIGVSTPTSSVINSELLSRQGETASENSPAQMLIAEEFLQRFR